MILNDLQIYERLARRDDHRIVVTPILDLNSQLGPSSLDIHLGTEFRVFQRQLYTHFDMFAEEDKQAHEAQRYAPLLPVGFERVTDDFFVLHPGEFALASTLEYISLPNDVAARLEGRSSWGRMGLQIHSTAGFIDPGFRGTVTYELTNLGKVPITLYVGFRVGQLGFYQLSEDSLIPYSAKAGRKYHHQLGTQYSRYFHDPEITRLRERYDRERLQHTVEELRRRGFEVREPPQAATTPAPEA